MSFDTVVRGGTIDVAIADGVIAELAPGGELGEGRETIDATGLLVLPGLVDAHVHLNDPGRSEWEGFATGTRALAAGGFSCAVDMPLNSIPSTVSASAFDAKMAAAKATAHIDFALWGGLVPGSVGAMEDLAACGVVGFKAFMADSGNDDFEACDALTLYEGMCRAAELGLPVAVHAENAAMVRELGRRALAEGRTSMAGFIASRPVAAEIEAIASAIALAGEAGCALHIVHVSCGSAAALVAEAKAAGADVTCETCPHYLALTDEDAERIGLLAKCAPPLRTPAERDGLWRALRLGTIDLIASDHSPAPPELKRGNALEAWGGISGCQTTARVLLAEGLAPSELARLCAAAPAERFGLPGGRVEPGAPANLLLLDPAPEGSLMADELLYRHPQSPFVGRTLRGRVARTMLRGHTVAIDGRPVGEPRGQLVRPRSRRQARSARTS
jgi:allantoinase